MTEDIRTTIEPLPSCSDGAFDSIEEFERWIADAANRCGVSSHLLNANKFWSTAEVAAAFEVPKRSLENTEYTSPTESQCCSRSLD